MGRSPSTIFGVMGAVLPVTVVGRPSINCGSGVFPAATVAARQGWTVDGPGPAGVETKRGWWVKKQLLGQSISYAEFTG